MSIRSSLRSLLKEMFNDTFQPVPPIIATPFGNVTESARSQAAANMAANPELRANVFKIVLAECGGDEDRARVEFNRRYPEAKFT